VCVLGEELAAKEHMTNRAAGLHHKAVSVFGYIGLDYLGTEFSNAEEQIRGLDKWKISGGLRLVTCCYRKL